MVSRHHFQNIRKYRAQGLNKKQIAEKLGLNWKTVSKYWESNTPPGIKDRVHRTREDPLQTFHDRIDFLIKAMDSLKAVDIYELLSREGYLGSLRTVERKVSEIQGLKPKERFFEQEYTPGEQTQFDFKEKVELRFWDGPKRVNFHFGTLPYSGKTWVKVFPFLNFECFIDGVHSFFENLGGQTSNIRIDNLSPCVQSVLRGRSRLWTSAFTEAIDHYGFGVLPCTPVKGNEKGHVERDIQTYARRIEVRAKLEGKVFRSWDDLNEWLRILLNEEFEKKGAEAAEKLLEEQQRLLRLPPRNLEILCRVEIVRASSFGTVRVQMAVYSVPDEAIGCNCTVVAGPYDVKIYRAKPSLKAIPLTIHPRVPDGGESIQLSHILGSLLRKPQAMIRWRHQEVLFPTPVFETTYKRLVKQDPYSAEREYLRALNLIQYTTLKELETALELVIERAQFKSPADWLSEIKDLILEERRPSNIIDLGPHLRQVPLKPNLSDYDAFIPTKTPTEI